MKTGNSTTSLNLPTLLSFNELAWVAVSAMALFCGYLLSQNSEDTTAQLQQQMTAANNDLAALRADRADLSNRLAQATADLAEARRRTAELEARLPREEARARSQPTELAQAQDEALKLKRTLAEAERRQGELEARLASATELNRQLEERLREATDHADELKNELVESHRELEGVTIRLAEALGRLAQRPNEGNVRKELLGLRGPMTNVVILLDRSSSMADGRRWEDSLRVIETWLEYLPIEYCALITFSSDCQAIPGDGQYLTVGGGGDAAHRARTELIRQVRARPPKGSTATVEALQRAYNFPGVDTIILFTDGEPLDLRRVAPQKSPPGGARESQLNTSERRGIARAQIQEALALSRKHSNIPINVVALSDYFADWKAEFLLGLVRNTGGAFLGR
jgi:hypothetical protein